MVRWTLHLKDTPSARAAVAVGHEVYCFGWDTNNDQIEVFVFNTVTLRWVKLLPATTGWWSTGWPLEVPFGFDHEDYTAVLIDTIVYIWGGHFLDADMFNQHQCNNQLYAFDVDTHRWLKTAVSGDVPEGRAGHSACALGKLMYVYGGIHYVTQFIKSTTDDLHELDTTTMVWTLIKTHGTPPASIHHTATIIGTKMFVCGEVAEKIGVFDTKTNVWLNIPVTVRSKKRRAVWLHSAFAYNGELYVLCGSRRRRTQDSSALCKLNTKTFSWKTVEPKGEGPPRTTDGSCFCVAGDQIVFFHGRDLHILDLSPVSLKTLCKQAVTRYGLEQSGLPHNIKWELTGSSSCCWHPTTTETDRQTYSQGYYR